MSKSKADKIFEYGWDEDNRLAEVKENSAVIAQYFYDYRGARVKKIENGVETKYVYSGLNIARETANNVDTFYIYGPNIDEPFYSITNGVRSYYYPDGLGSVKVVKNASGENTYIYDSWGQIAKADAPIANPYGYTGREFTNTDLYYYRARYYQPGVGRFTSRDRLDAPVFLQAFTHQFIYPKNQPTYYTDPLGRYGAAASAVGAKVGRWIGSGYSCAMSIYGESRNKFGLHADGTATNASQHCWWSCETTRRCGRNVAFWAGHRHERFSAFLGGGSATQMDNHNNREGRDCGGECEHQKKNCDECCNEKLNNRELVVLYGGFLFPLARRKKLILSIFVPLFIILLLPLAWLKYMSHAYYGSFWIYADESARDAEIYLDGKFIGKIDDYGDKNFGFFSNWGTNSIAKGNALIIKKEGYKTCVGILSNEILINGKKERAGDIYAFVQLARLDSDNSSCITAGDNGPIKYTGNIFPVSQSPCAKWGN